MTRLNRTAGPWGAVATIALVLALAPAAARADRRPPFGNDAGMLETRVREDVERRIAPLLEQMAPGQADLSYVDVRVNRPTALATGTNPGFEDLGPGADFVAERIEINLQLDSKLPAPFRKDLKALIAGKLESLAVPVDIKERVLAYPTPRPQPPAPREPLPYYPPQPPPQAAAPAPSPAPPPGAAPPPARSPEPAGWPGWAVALLVTTAVLLVACLGLMAFIVAERRRIAAAGNAQARGANLNDGKQETGARALPGPDRLPEVRRALVEDRLLARRVLGEMLAQNELDKVARTVELVGPAVVDDLRTDPTHAAALRDAASRLDTSKAASAEEVRTLAEELYRRVLKHRMMGSGDPIEQEFAFLVGLPAARFAAILDGERPSARAAALRYAPVHLRTAYLDDRGLDERAALVGALADSRSLTKDYLMDVAATLRGRAIEQAHVGGGESSDIELLVEMVEDASVDERTRLLDAIGPSDPDKRRRVQALLVTDDALARIPDAVLGSASLSVPTEALTAFLRATTPVVTERFFAALPNGVASGLREELSLDIPVAPEVAADARRTVHRALRRALRERGLSIPGHASDGDLASGNERGKSGSEAGNGNGRKKVVAV